MNKKLAKKFFALSLVGISLLNTQSLTAFAEELQKNDGTLVMNDTTNHIEGLNASHMWSNDGGNSWSQGREGQLFRGTQEVRVAAFDQVVVDSSVWQVKSYPGGATVIYNGSVWRNAYWAEPSDIPGSASVWQKVKDLPTPLNIFKFNRFTGEEAERLQKEEAQRIQNEKKVIGYFSNWHGYKTDYEPDKPDYNYSQGIIDGKGYDPVDVPFDKITHVNYAFMVIDQNGELVSNDPWADFDDSHEGGGRNYINQITQLAEEHDVAAMVSIGGWTNSVDDHGFDHATATPERMDRFTTQLVDFMLNYHFEGIDIDWEYPENDEQKEKFVALIKQLREKMTAAGKENDVYYQLSIAVTANHEKMAFIAPEITNDYVDNFNVMTYDYRGGFDDQTGHQSPLYPKTRDDKDQKFNISATMEEYHKVYGIPKHKLMVGMSYYSRGFANVDSAAMAVPSRGAANGGSWDDPEQLAGLKPWWQLKEFEAKAKDPTVEHLSYHWDDEAEAPFIYDSEKKELFTYDNIASISRKVNYTIDQGYGGAIIWELAHDTPDTAELTTLVKNILSDTHVDITDETAFTTQRFHIGGQKVPSNPEVFPTGFSRLVVESQNGKISLVKHSDFRFQWNDWQNQKYVSVKISEPNGKILFDQTWNGNESVVGNGLHTFGTFAQYDLPEGSTVEIYHTEGPSYMFRTSFDQELKRKLGNDKTTYIYTMKNNKLELTAVK
ncbi:glycosyl hydrolase family 18 protein [Enterococcus hirae]